MANDYSGAAPELESISEMSQFLRDGETKPEANMVGLEMERLPYFKNTLEPVGYEEGIRPLLQGLIPFGWSPSPDSQNPTSLEKSGGVVALEPGGQFELATSTCRTLHDVAEEVTEFRHQLLSVCHKLGIQLATFGARPFAAQGKMPWMPRRRFEVLRQRLEQSGRRSLDMMLLSATTQVCFDFESEADMIKKVQTSTRLSPIVAAIFANSPYLHGKWTGLRSNRYAMWREIDADRCGIQAAILSPDFSYEKYIEWMLDVPMLFAMNGNRHEHIKNTTFRDFFEKGINDRRPTMVDFENHLGSVFPEVRLKKYIEMRSADAGPVSSSFSLAALWKGIFYDQQALDAAANLIPELSLGELHAMQVAAAQDALHGHGPRWHIGELAKEIVKISHDGLVRQALKNAKGEDESRFLVPAQEIVESGETLADDLIRMFGSGPFNEQERRDLMNTEVFCPE